MQPLYSSNLRTKMLVIILKHVVIKDVFALSTSSRPFRCFFNRSLSWTTTTSGPTSARRPTATPSPANWWNFEPLQPLERSLCFIWLKTKCYVAALIPDKKTGRFHQLIFFYSNQNVTSYIWDQCCHQQVDGAHLNSLSTFFCATLFPHFLPL